MTVHPQRPPVRDGLAIAGAGLILYLLLGQSTFYEADGQGIVKQLAAGGRAHYLHFLFMPMLGAVKWLLAPLDLGAYRVACVASALGTATGVLFLHRAAAWFGRDRRTALWIGLFVATAPAVVFFATIVEFHGVFFAFAGLAWLALAGLVARPGVGRAMLLGAATCLAACVHGTGQLLTVLLFGWFLGESWTRRRRAGRALALVVLAAGTHLALFVALQRALDLPAGNQIAYWGRYLAAPPPALELVEKIWSEWLLPFCPLSVLSLAALSSKSEVFRLAAFALALPVYLTTCYLLIPGGTERGAYQLPLAFAAALLAAARLPPPRWRVAALLAGMALAVVQVVGHDTGDRGRPYVEALRAATSGEDAVLLMGSLAEVNPVARLAPEVQYEPFYDWVLGIGTTDPAQRGSWLAMFDAYLQARWAEGKSVFLCADARRLLENERIPAATELRAHLGRSYRLDRIEHGPFLAFRIRPRE